MGDLEEHQKENLRLNGTSLTTNLKKIMEANYLHMRDKAGIQEVLDNSDGSDFETE
jgi:hypothetical protein